MKDIHWNLDSFMEIGSRHLVCEDYVLVDQVKQAVIICDGCSSSPHTDLGARILAHCARRVLLDNRLECYDLGRQVVNRAWQVLESMDGHLSQSSLDATLLIGYVVGQSIRVFIYGDGMVAARDLDGNIDIRVFILQVMPRDI